METAIRKKENLHIVFWLIKDFSWLMGYKILGILMAPPTFLLSVWITYKSRKNTADFSHNLAVTFWITGNIIWMLGEFYCNDCTRPYAIPAFAAGFVSIGWYYLGLLKKKKAA
jgi:hypothetical protein